MTHHLHHCLREVAKLSELKGYRCPELFLSAVEDGDVAVLTEDELVICNQLIAKGYTKHVKSGEIK